MNNLFLAQHKLLTLRSGNAKLISREEILEMLD